VRLEARGGVVPSPACVPALARALEDALLLLEAHGRALLDHVAYDLGVDPGWFHALLDPDLAERPRGPPAAGGAADAPSLRHSLVRACRYVAGVPGVGGSTVQCDEHTDVGFLTLDAHANAPGLELRRRADRQWLPAEAAGGASCATLAVMVGDTLARATAGYYEATPHRVHAPPSGERIGLPFLLRGRLDAVLDTRAPHAAAAAAGRTARLARMESSTIKDLPSLDAAQSILQNWFRSSKHPPTPGA
jgi:isopenicillin N synthase-like dioxygenase